MLGYCSIIDIKAHFVEIEMEDLLEAFKKHVESILHDQLAHMKVYHSHLHFEPCCEGCPRYSIKKCAV